MNQPYKTPRLYQAYILVAQGYLHATFQDGDGAVVLRGVLCGLKIFNFPLSINRYWECRWKKCDQFCGKKSKELWLSWEIRGLGM